MNKDNAGLRWLTLGFYAGVTLFVIFFESRVGWLMTHGQDTITMVFILLCTLVVIVTALCFGFALENSENKSQLIAAWLGVGAELFFIFVGIALEQSTNIKFDEKIINDLLKFARMLVMPLQAITLFFFAAVWLSSSTSASVKRAQRHAQGKADEMKAHRIAEKSAQLLETGYVDDEIEADAQALVKRHRKPAAQQANEVADLKAQLAALQAQFNARPAPTVGLASDVNSVPSVGDVPKNS